MILGERSYLIKPEHVVGTVNEVVHIWRYQDRGDRERRRAALDADPARQVFRKKTSSHVMQMRNRILRPTSFSPMR